MLIKINRERDGSITLDEGQVCSMEFLRPILNKYGRNAIAYIVWYADVDSDFYDMPHSTKEEMLATSCGLKESVYKSKEVKDACDLYEQAILNTPQGIFLASFKKKMYQIGQLLNTETVTMENLEDITKALKDNSTLPQKVSEIQKQYKDVESDIRKFLIKGSRSLTNRESKKLKEFLDNK